MDISLPNHSSLSKRQTLILLLSAVFLGIAFIYGIYWLLAGRFHLYTENAYVGGNLVQLMPQVTGVVTNIAVDDTDLVEEGQTLVQLDDTDAKVNLQNAQAALAAKVREVVQYYTNKEALTAALSLAKAELIKAQDELKRRKKLVGIEAVSREELDRNKVNVVVAKTKNEETLRQLEAAVALVKGTTVANHPAVQVAAAKVRAAYLDFIRTTLKAPVKGYIAKRTVQPGQQVMPGMPLLVIVPLNEIWIDANYKETSLRNIRIGQPATVISEVYGDALKFDGKVVGISPGTGAIFSLLPPQNATGNWIKILQRLPVRVALDSKQLAHHPLRVGMTATVMINTHNRLGKMLATVPTHKAIYNTNIYKNQMTSIDAMITKIIHENANI